MQQSIADLTRRVATLLAGPLKADGIYVTLDFPAKARPRPLRDPIIAVGVQSAELTSRAMADYWGNDVSGLLSGRMLELTVSLLICAPPSSDGALCQKIFGALCDILFFDAPSLAVSRVWCGKLSFDREIEALILPCFARLRLPICHSPIPDGDSVESVRVLRSFNASGLVPDADSTKE